MFQWVKALKPQEGHRGVWIDLLRSSRTVHWNLSVLLMSCVMWAVWAETDLAQSRHHTQSFSMLLTLVHVQTYVRHKKAWWLVIWKVGINRAVASNPYLKPYKWASRTEMQDSLHPTPTLNSSVLIRIMHLLCEIQFARNVSWNEGRRRLAAEEIRSEGRKQTHLHLPPPPTHQPHRCVSAHVLNSSQNVIFKKTFLQNQGRKLTFM